MKGLQLGFLCTMQHVAADSKTPNACSNRRRGSAGRMVSGVCMVDLIKNRGFTRPNVDAGGSSDGRRQCHSATSLAAKSVDRG